MTTNREIANRIWNENADHQCAYSVCGRVCTFEFDNIERALDEKDALLKERDATIEALRKELKELQDWRTGKKGVEDYYTLKAALAAEKERAEAYREVAIAYAANLKIAFGAIWNTSHIDCARATDNEARKLLAEREGRKA